MAENFRDGNWISDGARRWLILRTDPRTFCAAIRITHAF
jgi:hypothetical protein